MDPIILKSTQKGYFSKYGQNLFWLVVLWILADYTADFRKTIGRYDVPWPHFIMYVSYIIMAIIFISSLYTFFYKSREVNTFFKNKDGFLNKLVCESYGFPFSIQRDEMTFDKVTQIQIFQGSIDRLVDSGSIIITMVTFTNADSQEYGIIIPAIENPYQRKLDLESALSVQEGLKVKIS